MNTPRTRTVRGVLFQALTSMLLKATMSAARRNNRAGCVTQADHKTSLVQVFVFDTPQIFYGLVDFKRQILPQSYCLQNNYITHLNLQ